MFLDGGKLQKARCRSDREATQHAHALGQFVNGFANDFVLLVPQLVERHELRSGDIPVILLCFDNEQGSVRKGTIQQLDRSAALFFA